MIKYFLGILTSRFRVCANKIEATPETVDSIIGACVVLHNFVRKTAEKDDNNTNEEMLRSYRDQYDNDGNIVFGTVT